MSTHSGAINSLAAATTHDIYLPLTKRTADDPRALRMGRFFALGWGTVLTLRRPALPRSTGTPAVVVALVIASFTYGGPARRLLSGILWSRAVQRDAIIGMSIGIAVMAVIVFAKPLVGGGAVARGFARSGRAIAWPWYVLIGTSSRCSRACSLHSLTRRRQPGRLERT